MAASQSTFSLLKRCMNNTSAYCIKNPLFQSNPRTITHFHNKQFYKTTKPSTPCTHHYIQSHNFCSVKAKESTTTKPKEPTPPKPTSSSSTSPSAASTNPPPPDTTPSDAEIDEQREAERKKNFIHDIMVENKKWCFDHGFNAFQDGLTQFSFLDKQTPISTVLSCCDSRAPTSALGSEAPNQIFSVRNIGNQFCNSIGSFRYGLEVLKTPYAIIMGHTNCGAIRGAASDYRGLHTMVQQEVISLVRVIRFADSLTNSAKLDEMPFDYRCNVYAEINVDYQIARLLDDYQINERVQSGQTNLIGMMFDVHNVYQKGYGRLHVVNINGDRDILSLKQHPLLTKVKDVVDGGEGDAAIEYASRLFSYPSDATQSSRFSHS